MGFLSNLLGGSKPKLETKSLSLIDPKQREALNALLAQLSGRKPTPFEGQLNAGLTGGERSSLTALEQRSQALAMPDSTFNAADESVKSLLDFEGQTADASEFFKTNVQDPLVESFGREILPGISRNFGGADFFSSERQATEGLARQDLLEALAASKSGVELDQFNRSRDRALTAAGLVPGLETAETQNMTSILDALGLPRHVEQEGLDRDYQEFIRMLTEDEGIQRLLAQLALTPTMENIGTASGGSGGILATLLGALAQGFGQAKGASIGGP